MLPIGYFMLSIGSTIILALAPARASADQLSVVGTGDGIEILKALGSAFNRMESSAEIAIPPSIGSGGGVAAVGAGKARLGRVARRLTEAEQARGLIYTPIARLPSAFFVHPAAEVRDLSAAQLAGIYAGGVTNWKEVGGADLRIRVVRREEADSTLLVLRNSMPGWRDIIITERSKLASSTQEAIETVRLVEGAIGFGPFTHILAQGSVVLTVDGRHPTDRTYPSSAELAFIHRDATLTRDAKMFIAFARSASARSIISALGALPPP